MSEEHMWRSRGALLCESGGLDLKSEFALFIEGSAGDISGSRLFHYEELIL